MNKHLCIIAHNIRSAYNIGAIFRTADGVGAKKIYLTGYSPCPLRRACPHSPNGPFVNKAQKMIAKTALGAEGNIKWEKKRNVGELIRKLREEGFQIIALEQNPKSIDYASFKPRFPLAIIVGNEPKGIHSAILSQCDAIIEIPMQGKKNSLNVAVALGVAGYRILRKGQ